MACGCDGEQDGGEVPDERFEKRVASRGEIWSESGMRGHRSGVVRFGVAFVWVRCDSVIQGFPDLRRGKLKQEDKDDRILTEGMSYFTESARASSA